ncbi:hypothetical protein BS47DRAFT_1005204 [Hydnum rufescens UP504]|uniref:Uncharacterized protein n=1 Tax=Hydnum rufescens UP504 TaxID=1448309 RepID=A0A9P6E1Q1_9AGAM|nr:hypothetical protein BS47DRAFT_1005204 [Hydnum rufescens UP504]
MVSGITIKATPGDLDKSARPGYARRRGHSGGSRLSPALRLSADAVTGASPMSTLTILTILICALERLDYQMAVKSKAEHSLVACPPRQIIAIGCPAPMLTVGASCPGWMGHLTHLTTRTSSAVICIVCDVRTTVRDRYVGMRGLCCCLEEMMNRIDFYEVRSKIK